LTGAVCQGCGAPLKVIANAPIKLDWADEDLDDSDDPDDEDFDY